MSDTQSDWKDDRIQSLKESLAFFSNSRKLDREKWVVRRLLRALRVNFKEEEMAEAQEPVDVAFRDMGFQVKELLDERRRRTDEFKNKLEAAKSANNYSELLEQYTPTDIAFSEIVGRCFLYAETLQQCKYGPRELKNIDLVCYFNWLDHHVVPPIEVPDNELRFRSLSIVSNRYCAVAYASPEASTLLRDSVGKATEILLET